MTDARSSDTDAASAISIDGRVFQFAGSLHSAFEPGGFVVLLSEDGDKQLGQVEDVTFAIGGALSGVGRILGAVSDDGLQIDRRRTAAFARATVHSADAQTIEALHDGSAAALTIGSYLASEDIPARLLPSRFNRHTFWCGQSGSGKTYALGVVLEQLLLHTSLPMVIFDPNGDFVRMREANPDAKDTAAGETLSSRDVRVLRPSSPNPNSLRVRFVDLPAAAKAAVFSLHPLADRDEYAELIHLEETAGTIGKEGIIPHLLERDTAAARALVARI